MKRGFFTAAAAFLCAAACAFGLVGCGHSHTFSEEWSHDAGYHWHTATCEHTDERSDYGAHTMAKTTLETYNATVSACSVCGYTEGDVSSQFVDEAAFTAQLGADLDNFRYVYKVVDPDTGAVQTEEVAQYDGTCYVNENGTYYIGYNTYTESPYIEGVYEQDRPATITAAQRVESIYTTLAHFQKITDEELGFSDFHWSDEHYLNAEPGYFLDLNGLSMTSVFHDYGWFSLRFENGTLKAIDSGYINGYGYRVSSTFELGAAQISLPWEGDAPAMEHDGSSCLQYKLREGGESYTLYNYFSADLESGSTVLTVADTCNGLPVTQIRSGCFENNGISSGGIVIPVSVTSFGSNAFTGSRFASVYYMGTAEQWAAISGLSLSGINKTVNSYLGATVYCYSESEPSVTGSFWHYVGGAPTPW